MINVSYEFKAAAIDEPKYLSKAELVLASGKRVNLTGDDFLGEFQFDHSTSAQGTFEVGAAVTGSFRCSLNNIDQRFEKYDFTGSRLIVQLGLLLPSGVEEWIRKGTY